MTEHREYVQKSHVEMLPYMAAFAVVVETGSFIEASIRLGLTPSAVSKQISKLESVLSLRLIERSTRQLKVNAEGAEIYPYCRNLIDSAANVFKLKDGFLEKPQGLIRVVVPSILYGLCNQLMPEFLCRYPEVSVQLISSDSSWDLISDSIDICIKVTNSPPLGLIARKLFKVGFILCASEKYLEQSGVPCHPAELSSHSCIPIAGAAENEQWEFSTEGENCDVKVSGRYFSDSPEAVLNATLSGLGISCLPTIVVSDLIEQNQLVQLLAAWEYIGPSRGMAWILYKSNKHVAQRIKVMVEYLLLELRPFGQIQ
ncbi:MULTISPECIES: LysR family transcriptional regulator [unclassified Pseudomonas]|uniref:LysR family transcriptional regulator n=1 Tax=unclassified Pseudomonas TaxID=196821 RepID=UPI002B237D41|nr:MULTISPECIES: LysR family transcriptional regulator [unclassified Pseudomonas]MEA9977286.1 LysR family transcriptional regulator [Pseudomonas sp. RTS4]MEB0199964.1 LysR family transcriptional regulator [Pseudomonas sp. 5S4]MEB0247075.1 LysR family transcriptional regulator [Pseudomonas sp. 10S5]